MANELHAQCMTLAKNGPSQLFQRANNVELLRLCGIVVADGGIS